VAILEIVGLFALVVLHFAPTLIAASRKHPRRIAIFVINLLFGWTVVGWIAALVWALSPPHQPATDLAPQAQQQ
jgi:CHASE2 domain-containing sensor protein